MAGWCPAAVGSFSRLKPNTAAAAEGHQGSHSGLVLLSRYSQLEAAANKFHSVNKLIKSKGEVFFD